MRLSRAQVARLLAFLDILEEWNRRFGLVGPAAPDSMVRKHLLDSLAPARILATRDGLIDLGSGAGLPGIPLSIACPRLHATLVDSRQARVSFVREVVRRLPLPKVTAEHCRVEDLIRTGRVQRGSVDAAISRAWTGLPRFLDACSKLVRPGGIAIGMKGPGATAELAAIDPPALGFREPELIPYSLPGGMEQRILIVFERC